MTKKNPKIADNPSVQELKRVLPLVQGLKAVTGILKAVGLKGGKVQSIYASAEDILSQADLLVVPI